MACWAENSQDLEVNSFVCFLWRTGFRDYRPEQVSMLARAIKHFYPYKHRFICVSAVLEGFSDAVEVLRMPKASERVAHVGAPQVRQCPYRTRRLWGFAE